MESQTLISSKEFCIENMISDSQQMVFVSYKRIIFTIITFSTSSIVHPLFYWPEDNLTHINFIFIYNKEDMVLYIDYLTHIIGQLHLAKLSWTVKSLEDIIRLSQV